MSEKLREALRECIGQLDSACSPYVDGIGRDREWKHERDEIVRNTRAALAEPAVATVSPHERCEEDAK